MCQQILCPAGTISSEFFLLRKYLCPEPQETLRGKKSPIAAGMGAGFHGSAPPGAKLAPASPELSLSHIWKKALQKVQQLPVGIQAEHISPLAGREQNFSFYFLILTRKVDFWSWWERRDSLNQQFAVSTADACSACYLVNKPCSEKERPVYKSSS